ncbi:hypothetical protein SAMN06297144_1852 [Sphingomonas guangdongensis]|uniref:BZIP domain-containing protein n=1 Tax=Sphingomonas guangdongensis TaxID=1141890 RepID=A0A285QXV9_9SPHN|nr:hypothetical protein [Sphingomonas guangdongensis]SOB86743.1 hypothetical protein SAMN06297144_1852 [Sphingomonas guangdongensis]
MRVTVDEAAPGSGKTFRAINDAISFKGKYLFVTERRHAIRAVAGEVRASALQRGRNLVVEPLSSDEDGINVRESVEYLPSKYAGEHHIIAVISHAALLMSDLTDFDGWHLIIDETPAVLAIQEVRTLRDAAFFHQHYDLAELDGYQTWSTVSPTGAGKALTSRHLFHDDSHRHLRAFHGRVLESHASGNRKVVCSLSDWDQMTESVEFDDGSKKARQWVWGSLFTLNAVTVFTSVLILANRFSESLTYKLLNEAAKTDGLALEWVTRRTTRPIVWEKRRVNVVYFSDRNASRFHFASEGGRENLQRIDSYLASRIDQERFIWSVNESIASSFTSLPAARRLRIKQAGSNEFAGCNQAAVIYSAKPSPNIEGLLKVHGVTAEDWRITNEFEVILQFVTRTSIRDPRSAEEVTLYVYDIDQASYLLHQLALLDHVEVTFEKADVAINDQKKRRGRKPRELTEAEVAERAARRREQNAVSARKARAKAKGEAA